MKYIKIGCFTYSVSFQESDGSNHGSTCMDTKRIFLDKEMPLQCQQETLLHELCHACFDDCPSFKIDYKDPETREEDIIRFLSPRMFQVLRDNKWVRDFMFGKDKK